MKRLLLAAAWTVLASASARATATTLALFGQWREMLMNQKPDAWLFPSETGLTPIWYTNVLDRSIRPALEKIGLAHATFQVLRRTWVTEFSAAEKDPAIRAQLAGHGRCTRERIPAA